jgi:hypothetical protein
LAVVIKLEARAASRIIFNSPQEIRQTKAALKNKKGALPDAFVLQWERGASLRENDAGHRGAMLRAPVYTALSPT